MLIQILKNFIIKDLKLDIRYPFFFFFKFFEIFIFVTIGYYASTLMIKIPENKTQDYFSYLLVGLSFFSIFRTGLYTYTEELTRYIQTGNFEYLMTLPVNEIWLVILSGLWKHIISTLRVIFYFFIGIHFYNAHIQLSNIPEVLLIYILSIVCFSGLGLFSAGILIYFKKAEPVNWMISQLCLITGGVLFPSEILPNILQKIGDLNPVTYSLKLFRSLMLNNNAVIAFNKELYIFLFLTVLFLIIGFLSISYSIKKGKESGILSFY